MPATNLTLYSVQDAIQRGHDVYDVMIARWGTDLLDRYPTVGVPPFSVNGAEFPITPAGIAIGPRSTVDRCWVSWNPQVQPYAAHTLDGMYRVITHERPLMFAQPSCGGRTVGGNELLEDAMSGNLLYIFPTTSDPPPDQATGVRETTCVPTGSGYFKADGSTFVDWAPTDTPILHLQFFLKPNLQPPAGKRLPYNYRATKIFNPAAAGTENLVALLPAYGRKRVHIQMSSEQTITSYRIGALRQIQPPTFTGTNIETTEGLKGITTAIVDGAVTPFTLCDPDADYIALYATFTGAGLSSVSYTFTACD